MTTKATEASIKRLVMKRRAQGMAWADIAAILGVSVKTMNSYARKFGLVNKEQGEKIRQGVMKAIAKQRGKQ